MLDEWYISGAELLVALLSSALAAFLTTSFAFSIFSERSLSTQQTRLDRIRARWACLGTLTVVAALHLNRPDEFVYTHYLFGYTEEFVRRGLIGQLVSMIPGQVDDLTVGVISAISLATFIVLMLRIFLPLGSQHTQFPDSTAREGYGAGLSLLGMVVVLSPVTLQHFMHDFGRHDVLLMLILIAALNAVISLDGTLRGILVSVLLVISVLIHEASVFFVAGPVCSFWMSREGWEGCWFTPLAICALACVTVLVVVLGPGDYSSLPFDVHLAEMTITHGPRVDALAVSVLHASTADSIGLVLTSERLDTFVEHHLVFGAVMGPLLAGIVLLLTNLPWQMRRRFAFALLGCLAPLALYPLGYDHFRWLSLIFTTGFIVGSMVLSQCSAVRHSIDETVQRHRKLFLIILWLGIVSGPLRVSNSFYWISPLADTLSAALR